MPHEPHHNAPPASEPYEWSTGDSVYLVLALTYAGFNVVHLLRYAQGNLGPVPFQLLDLFIGGSLLGMLMAFPIQLMLRRFGVTWRSALAVTIIFVALTGFNAWCSASAAAAV